MTILVLQSDFRLSFPNLSVGDARAVTSVLINQSLTKIDAAEPEEAPAELVSVQNDMTHVVYKAGRLSSLWRQTHFTIARPVTAPTSEVAGQAPNTRAVGGATLGLTPAAPRATCGCITATWRARIALAAAYGVAALVFAGAGTGTPAENLLSSGLSPVECVETTHLAREAAATSASAAIRIDDLFSLARWVLT